MHPWPLNGHLPRSISSISSNSTISSSSTVFGGLFLFNISLKCPTHLCSPSLASVLSTPCLSLTPISCFRLSPVIDSVTLYSSLLLQFSAAFSVAAALFSNQFLLSSLACCFSSLFFALYSSLHLCFSRSDLQFQFCLLPLLDLFPCFASYPWPTMFFWPPHDFLCCISLCCQNHVVFFSGSSMSPKASNLFLISILYLLLISLLCSLLTSNLSLTFFLPSAVPNFRRILV